MVGFSISYASSEREIMLVRDILAHIAVRYFGNTHTSIIPIAELAKFFRDFTCKLGGEGELLVDKEARVHLRKIFLRMNAADACHSRLTQIMLSFYYDSSDVLCGRMMWCRKRDEDNRNCKSIVVDRCKEVLIAYSLENYFYDKIDSSPDVNSDFMSQLTCPSGPSLLPLLSLRIKEVSSCSTSTSPVVLPKIR